MTDITAGLIAFAHAPVTHPAALAMMRLSLRDWAACGIAGRDEDVSRIVGAHVRATTKGSATPVGGGAVSASGAALANGTAAHALDYDDTHFAHIGHPSVAVIPAALAVAEGTGASLGDVLQAALVGVEASIRVGIWLGRGHYQTGFHQTATAGAFGATLAAARLLRLDPGQTGMALGLAATRAAGLKAQFGTMAKPYNAGIAAQTGVEAAELAQAGMTAAPDGLAGPQGFGPTHHGVADAAACDGLGEVWRIETISHKFHACCHGLHAMLEALSEVDATGVQAVTIRTHPRWLSVCNIARPATGLEAKFSYRLTAAMRLLGVDTGAIASYTDAMAADPALCALRDRVDVAGDDSLTEMQAQVTLTRGDGPQVVLTHDLDAPLAPADRAERLRRKAEALLGAAGADALWRATAEGEAALQPLLACLAAPA